MESLQIAGTIIIKFFLPSIWIMVLGALLVLVSGGVVFVRTQEARKKQRIEDDKAAEKKRREDAAKIIAEAESHAKAIVTRANFEYQEKLSKVDAWKDHLQMAERSSRRSKEIVKLTTKHVCRILAELDQAKKKGGREPSLRNIRQSCRRILTLESEIEAMPKEGQDRPEPLE